MPTRSNSKPDAELAKVQLAATDQEALLPAGEQVTEVPVTDDADAPRPGFYAEMAGRKFRLSDETGYMALMEWAAAGDGEASIGQAVTSNLRAMYHVLEDIVDPAEWDAFRAHTREKKVQYPDFLDFQNRAFEALSANPTR